jgi:hypothetical protein
MPTMSVSSSFLKTAMRPTCAMCATINKAFQDWLRQLRDPYRPEHHYMRGPGPKCREKASRNGGRAG